MNTIRHSRSATLITNSLTMTLQEHRTASARAPFHDTCQRRSSRPLAGWCGLARRSWARGLRAALLNAPLRYTTANTGSVWPNEKTADRVHTYNPAHQFVVVFLYHSGAANSDTIGFVTM